MTKHFCWICNEEILFKVEMEKRGLNSFSHCIIIEEICAKCEDAIVEFLKKREEEYNEKLRTEVRKGEIK